MRAHHAVSLIAVLSLAGCDRFTGAAEQKIQDAQAVGYACRVSMKVPEDCMKENETHSPTAVLNGWKDADKDIVDRVIDPSMGKRAAASTIAAHSAPAAAKTSRRTEAEPATGKAPDPKEAVAAEKAPTAHDKDEPGKKPAH